MATLTLEHISYKYKKADKDVLKDVSCRFCEGEMATIIGPSGSGKTTLLSILAGLDEPGAGAIDMDGKNVLGMDRDLWRRQEVSVIFQSFQLFPLLTVLENVTFPMELNGVSKRRPGSRQSAIWSLWGLRRRNISAIRPTSPAASSSAWRSREALPAVRKSFSPTSPPAIWTGRTRGISYPFLCGWRTSWAIVSSS